MAPSRKEIVVAGHICLDLIPRIDAVRQSIGELLVPGKLLNVGPVVTSTGGPVANTGIALHRLGYPVRLVGKVGADPFGDVVLGILRGHDPALAKYMVRDAASDTSYSVVISPPGIDRMFLHCPGANDTFGEADVQPDHLEGAALLHFGYPPLMKRIYGDGGVELSTIFSRARSMGLVTSLDMSTPDPNSESGRVDWQAFLSRVLTSVDVFLPSYGELCFMLRETPQEKPDPAQLSAMGDRLIRWGASIVVIKMGTHGLYLRTAASPPAGLPRHAWSSRELYSPCHTVKLVGATGSGDCTIAGFLGALCEQHATPEPAVGFAVAVGACNVEAPDATSGVRSRADTLARIAAGWSKNPVALSLPGWRHNAQDNIWHSPRDPDPFGRCA